MANSLTADVRTATTWSMVLSVLMIGAGVLAITAPMIAGVAVTAIVGWLLVLSGLFHLAFAWGAGRPAAVLWQILIGVLYGAIGFYIIASPVAGLASLTLAIALYLFIEGVLEFVLWSRLRAIPGSGWVLVDGIITLVLAVMIWSTWPSSAVWVVGTLIGISMFFSGITRLMLSIGARRFLA
jgi:uncharacterized membrane protein HdeD (DUF308 family)